jgi:hypothetical protein
VTALGDEAALPRADLNTQDEERFVSQRMNALGL